MKEPEMTESMTWGEFKQAVDKAGVKDDEEIWFIDISFPSKGDFEQERITAGRQGNLGVCIC